MKKIILTSLIVLFSFHLFAQNNDLRFSGWKKAETEHFNFIFEEAQREATEGFIYYADDAWNKIAKIYSMPQGKTNVYITGRTNTVNAFTFSSPTEIMMFTNPCTMVDFTFRDNWQKLFFTHELIHVANFRFEDRNQSSTKIFGSYMLNLDFANVNGWALEGLTTVLETELTNGGRGRSPYFEMEYKAPTLDNGFMSYDEIGMEKEPPYGQSYVMGYLIMKSIADRYGLNALADIERNREFMGSWEDSVKLVTGETAQDIFRDVRISIAKKYADERKIPEGLIISPREVNTNYYKPAIIFDDGTLIALRTAQGQKAAVVRLDPSAKAGSSWVEDTKPEEDLNTILKETILFTGSFVDGDSVTADENGTIYAVLGDQRNDRNPGVQLEAAIYTWTKDDGITQLTKGVSLFQPSVSRNGKVLVAVQQQGMTLRLVKVDTESGKVDGLLESKELSFASPAVNADGTKVAFLVLDDTRARVAVMDLSNPEKYEIVANDDETIYDPAYPNWNADGTLTYSCNYRGRLESFAVENNNGKWTSKPVVSDPIGSTWTYKNDKGIFYTSFASSGKVIKIKPVSEWGNVADFDGPSPAGEKICFGHLQNDFPEFKPYTILSEVEVPEETKEEKKAAKLDKLKKADKDEEKPTPIKGKTVKHRTEENKKAAEEANSTITTLQNEKKYVALPQPILYFPFFNLFEDGVKNEVTTGFGLVGLAMTPKLQMNAGIILGSLFYFPKNNNFTGTFDVFIPVGSHQLDLVSSHTIETKNRNGITAYLDKTILEVGYTIPLLKVYKQNYNALTTVFAASTFYMDRYSQTSININNKDFVNEYSLNGYAGSETYYKFFGPKDSYLKYDSTLVGIGNYSIDLKEFDMGVEGDTAIVFGTEAINTGVLLKGRYTPFPANTTMFNTRITYGGQKYDCTFPGMFVPQINASMASILLPGVQYRAYSELLAQFGNKNIAKKPFFTENAMFGIEAAIEADELEMCFGVSYKYNFDESDFDEEKFKWYFTFKYNWMRF